MVLLHNNYTIITIIGKLVLANGHKVHISIHECTHDETVAEGGIHITTHSATINIITQCAITAPPLSAVVDLPIQQHLQLGVILVNPVVETMFPLQSSRRNMLVKTTSIETNSYRATKPRPLLKHQLARLTCIHTLKDSFTMKQSGDSLINGVFQWFQINT
jgi:hypothetical protein